MKRGRLFECLKRQGRCGGFCFVLPFKVSRVWPDVDRSKDGDGDSDGDTVLASATGL